MSRRNLEGSPASAALFHDTMRAVTQLVARYVARLELWWEVRSVVDMGGWQGELAESIADAQPTCMSRCWTGPMPRQAHETTTATAS